jgi:hypothetical protein
VLLDVRDGCRLGGLFASRELLSDAARARLDRIAPILPRSYSAGTFEVRLDGDEQVDYQLCFTTESGGRSALGRWLATVDDGAFDPAWRGALAFLRHWTTPGSRVHRHAQAAWLEFDCRLDDPAAPVPFPFFSLPPPWRGAHLERDETWATLVEGHDRLAGGPLAAEVRAAIRRAVDALPPNGCVLHTALRPVGAAHVTRLIGRMPVLAIAPYLARAGWPHPTAAFDAFVERHCPAKILHSVQLDVTADGVGPGIGLEFFWNAAPRTDGRWRRLFDLLVGAGACTPERRAQLEAWVGDPATDLLPWLLRGLLVKVVFRPDAPLAAKAYLPFCLNPSLRPGARRVDASPAVGALDAERPHALRGGADDLGPIGTAE